MVVHNGGKAFKMLDFLVKRYYTVCSRLIIKFK